MGDTVTSSVLECRKEELQLQLTNVNNLYRQCANKVETQNQEIYNQGRELGRLKCLEAEYLQEIEVLQLAEQSLAAKYEVKVKNLEDEVSNSKREHLESVDQYKLLLQEKDSEIEELRNLVKHIQDDFEKDTKLMNDLNKENSCLKDYITKLSERIEELTAINEDLEKQHSLAQDATINLRKEIAELHESYACKEEALHEANCLVLTLQEENALKKSELELLKSTPSKCKSQGNSLFAEVDEQRLKLQQTIAEMKVRYKELQREKNIYLRQISELQHQVATLCQQWNDEQKEKMNDEEREENSYKSQINALESLMSSYKQEILELQRQTVTNLDGDGVIEFIKKMTTNKNKEIEEHRLRITDLSTTRSLLCRQIKEANAEIRKLKAEVMRLNCKTGQLQIEIEKLKLNGEKMKETSSSSLLKLQDDLQVVKLVPRDFTGEMNRKLSNIDVSRQNRKSKADKENVEQAVAITKTVQFAEDTREPKITNRDKLHSGGKLIQVQSIHIPNIKKKLM